MSKSKARIADRVLAMILAVVLMVGLLPAAALADEIDELDAYTVTLSDGENAVDASIDYSIVINDEQVASGTVSTADGVATIDNMADYAEEIALEENTVIFNYAVAVENYEEVKDSVVVKSVVGNVDVVLTSIEYCTVTATKTGEGKVSLNGQEVESVVVKSGEEVSLAVEATGERSYATVSVDENTLTEKTKTFEKTFTVESDIDVEIAFEDLYSVEIAAGEGFTATINGEAADKVLLANDSEVELAVSANDGYQIDSVAVNGEPVELDEGVYLTTIKDADISVAVTAVKVWTVNFTYDEKSGTVESNPACEAGKIEIVNGKTFSFKVTPNANYRVSEVTINEGKEAFVENDKAYESSELTADKDYEITVSFALNNVDVTAKTADANGTAVTANDGKVEYGKDTTVEIKANVGYEIDGINLTVGEETKSFEEFAACKLAAGTKGNNYVLTIEGVTEAIAVEVSFKEVAAAEISSVQFNKEDALRVDGNTYVFGKTKAAFKVDGEAYKAIFVSDENSIDRLVDADRSIDSVVIDNDQIIKMIAVLADGNKAGWALVDGVDADNFINIVYDKKAPVIDTVTDLDKFFGTSDVDENGNVIIKVKATEAPDEEAENYTALAKVEYWFGDDESTLVSVDAEGTEKEILIAVPVGESIEGDIKVNVVAYDLAGNPSETAVLTVKVSTAAPKLIADVVKNNKNGAIYAENGFYTEAAFNITVIDGAAFDKDGIVVKVNGEEVKAEWGETNGNTHNASVKLDDGKYESWSVEYKNLANNSAEAVSKIDSFTVDSVAPTGDIASKEILDAETIILKIVTLGFYKGNTVFYEENVVDATNVTASYYLGQNNINEEDLAGLTFGSERIELEPKASGTVYIKLVDEAGNTRYLTSGRIIVTSGEGKVTLEAKTQPNGNGFYNDDIVFSVAAEDAELKEGVAEKDLVYAGINSIDYEVIVGEEVKASGNLRAFDANMDNLVRTAEETFTLDAEKFNYDNITVIVTVTDNANNKYSAQIDGINICTVDPTVEVKFNKPANEYNNRLYFKDETVGATVTITDRASAFDEEAASAALLASGLTDQKEIIWTNEGDVHTTDVSFSNEGSFTWKINYTNLAELTGSCTELFTIDNSNPTGKTWIDNNHSWSELIDILTFGIAKTETTVSVSASAEDDISGVKSIEYYKTDATTALKAEELDAVTFTEYTKALEFGSAERFTVYFKITDLSGRYSYISTNGIVIDNTDPEIAYTIDDPTIHGIYGINNKDGEKADTISIASKVTDAGISSGIKSVSYWVKVDAGTEQETVTKPETVLYENKIADPTADNLDYELSNLSFDVIKADNDSCNVTVYIKAVDYAGNETIKEISLDIDVTPPTIALSFDNNKVCNESYFDAQRTATIVYTERAAHFDQKAAQDGIVVVAKDFNGTELDIKPYIAWKSDDDSDTHTATVIFYKDANYTLQISYADRAGNVNSPIVVEENTVAPYNFTVDTAPATVSVTATPDNREPKTWNQDDKVSEAITFELTSPTGFTVSAVAVDAIAGVKSIEYYKQQVDVSGEKATGAEPLTEDELNELTEWTEYTEEIKIPGDQQCTYYFKVTDYSNHVTYIRTNGLTVDSTKPVEETLAPVIDAEVQPAPENGIYNGDVTVDVTVADPINGNAYSGLKEVRYEVKNMGEKTQEGSLFTFEIDTPKQSDLKQSFSEQIVIDSVKNNSNDVEVIIYAVDNAGNPSSKSIPLKIDIKDPVIDISYDNDDVDSGRFFKANRTATVVVTERNFDESDVIATIIDTDGGTAPVIGSFTKTKEGTGNGDDTQWTATIVYANDGDYTFDIAYTDEAENKCNEVNFAEGTKAPTGFTIDKTMPTVLVSYDNNNALNSNYYNAVRTATVTITEHNFDASRVIVMLTATDDGVNTALPTVSQWTTDGDKHTATIYYGADAKYSFDIAIKDLAGNESADFTEQQFYVDTTAPELEITGVLDNSANNGDIIPVVTYSDTNYNASDVTITLTGANRGNVELKGSYTDTHNGREFTFANFEKVKEVDDIYNLTATITDFAGNTTTQTIHFSANRFGSTFELDEGTKSIVGSYIQDPIDAVVYETNVNNLSNIKVTMFKNSKAVVLNEDEDYTISLSGGGGNWYRYTYTIFNENFADDGVYSIVIHSEDAAGNIAENTLDTKDLEIGFGVDNTNPNIIITNLEDGETYAEDSRTVVVSANDNLNFASMVVYLDGKETMKWNAQEISKIVSENGEFSFVVPGDSNHSHEVKIVCTDAAGNETVAEVNDFFVTTNLFVRYFNNKPLFYGSLLGVLALMSLIIVLKRKKDEDEEEEKTAAAN